MPDEMTTSKDVPAAEPSGSGVLSASGVANPDATSPDGVRSNQELADFRAASGIAFVSHADVQDNLIKAPDGIPSNLRVGREGEVPEVRADLHTKEGPRSEMQVDVHADSADVPTQEVNGYVETKPASTATQLRPAEAASDAPADDGPVLEVKAADEILTSAKDRKDTSEFDGNVDTDKEVIGHIDEDGNVHADNEPAEAGEFVQDPDAVTESAEANELPGIAAPSEESK